MEIGERIKQRREFLGMSQEELAHKVGYKSRSSVNKIEIDGRGLPQKKIIAFAKALETTPGYLMGWSNTDYTVPNDNTNILIEKQFTKKQQEGNFKKYQFDHAFGIYKNYLMMDSSSFQTEESFLRFKKYFLMASKLNDTQLDIIYKMIDQMSPDQEAATQNVSNSSSSTAPTLPKHLEDCRVDDDTDYSSTASTNS